MKETVIVRKIDKVGRIVIPKELRWKYQMDCGDIVEIFTDQDTIRLKKYNTRNNVMAQVETLYVTMERMEKELKNTRELEEYLNRVKNKLEKLKKE